MLASVENPQEFVESEVAENAIAGAIAETAGVDAASVDVTLTVSASRRLGDAAGRRLQKGKVEIQYTISVTEQMAASMNVDNLQEDLSKVTPEALTNKIVQQLSDLGSSVTFAIDFIEAPEVIIVESTTPSPGGTPAPDDGDLDSHCVRLAPFGILSVALLLTSLLM